MKLHIVINGRSDSSIDLPNIPRAGELISLTDPKNPVYLVHRVEYFQSGSVTLHVQEFANQISAVNAVDGFRNTRGWL